MPIYEYKCLKCDAVFEVFQKMSDPPPKKHECGGRKLKRVMSRTSFQLKGDGWYITDYGRKDADTKAKKAADKADKGDKSDKADKPAKTDKPKAASAA